MSSLAATTNASTTPAPSPSTIDTVLEPSLLVIFGVELTLNVLIVPIALVNFVIIFQTAVVHPNLRFILLVQSALIAVIALARSIQDVNIFIDCNPYGRGLVLCSAIIIFAIQFLDFLGHVLFAERVAATIWARWYERAPANWTLNGAWFIVLFILSAVYCWVQVYTTLTSTSLLNLGVNYALVLVSLCEWFGLAAVAWHNRNRYNWFTTMKPKTNGSVNPPTLNAKNAVSSLSERYQLSENVRTGRQLAVCFAMHFVDVACISIMLSTLFFFPAAANYRLISTIFALMDLVFAVTNLCILVSVILYHPVLHRNAVRLWRNLCSFFGVVPRARINPVSDNAVAERNPEPFNERTTAVRTQLRSLNGQPLAIEEDVGGDEHFAMLRAQWA